MLLFVFIELDFKDSANESIETSISVIVGRVLKFFAFFAGDDKLSKEIFESCACLATFPKGPFFRPVAGLDVRVELPLEEIFCTCKLPVFFGFFGSRYRGFTLLNFGFILLSGSVLAIFRPMSSDCERL